MDSLKNLTFRDGGGGGLTKNQYRGGEGNYLKRRGLGQFANLREGAWQEREGWCF